MDSVVATKIFKYKLYQFKLKLFSNGFVVEHVRFHTNKIIQNVCVVQLCSWVLVDSHTGPWGMWNVETCSNWFLIGHLLFLAHRMKLLCINVKINIQWFPAIVKIACHIYHHFQLLMKYVVFEIKSQVSSLSLSSVNQTQDCVSNKCNQ